MARGKKPLLNEVVEVRCFQNGTQIGNATIAWSDNEPNVTAEYHEFVWHVERHYGPLERVQVKVVTR